MLPVFKEYIQFLKDKTNNDDKLEVLSEGYYWLDRSIIKAFDDSGKIHKILRVNIDNDLNITIKPYKKPYTGEVESWDKTSIRLKDRIDELENESINLIIEKLEKYKNYIPIILTSSGKDSELTRYLLNKAQRKLKTNSNHLIIFNNTSLDVVDTYKMIKTIPNIITLNPKIGFYNQLKTWGVPRRMYRWCCSTYKEGTTKDYLDENEKYLFFYGMRNEESSKRANYEDERYDTGWGKREWMGILPIRKWTEIDVWLYTLRENIKFNTKYKKGYNRVGCGIACPFYTKSTWVLDKYWYPTMYKRWHNILEKDFIDNCKWTRLNCTLKEYHMCWNGGLLREEPTKEVIQEFADHKGISIEIAEKYFNKACNCGKKVNKKNDVAMNLKMLGRNTEKFMCKKCLMKFLGIDKKEWDLYIEEFKKTGCDLF